MSLESRPERIQPMEPKRRAEIGHEDPVNIRSRGAFAVIFRTVNGRKEVLLCHRKDANLYNLPGGGVNMPDPNDSSKDEKPENAVLREVFEETLAKAKIIRPVAMLYRPGPKKENVAFLYECELEEDEQIGNSDESDDTRFFPVDDLPYNLIPSHVERINLALKEIPPVLLHEEDYTLQEILKRVSER